MKFFIKRNDTRRAMKALLKDRKGNAVDLTGATVRFIMLKGSQVIINREPLVMNPVGGEVWVVFAPRETGTAGKMEAEFKVTYPDGKTETFPEKGYIQVIIDPDLKK